MNSFSNVALGGPARDFFLITAKYRSYVRMVSIEGKAGEDMGDI
jgi:hypothetical protein